VGGASVKKDKLLTTLACIAILLFFAALLAIHEWPEREYGDHIITPRSLNATKRKTIKIEEQDFRAQPFFEALLQDLYRQSRILKKYAALVHHWHETTVTHTLSTNRKRSMMQTTYRDLEEQL